MYSRAGRHPTTKNSLRPQPGATPVAKHTRKRNLNFVAIPFNVNLPLLTLADQTVLTVGLFPAVLNEDFYAISADVNAQVIALTAGEGDPLMAGYAHGDYSVGEIKENLEVSFLGPGSKIEQERARRIIRKCGMFVPVSEAATQMKLMGKEGSGMIRTSLKFVVQDGKNLSFWVHNRSGGSLTTGGTLRLQGTVYGRWIL